MARVHTTKTGKKIILRNPAEKAKRYARQLKNGYVTETGEKITKDGRAYRAGYLDSRKDSAKAWKYNRKKRMSYIRYRKRK